MGLSKSGAQASMFPSKITVGLTADNKVKGGIVLLKPPGGESVLSLEDEDQPQEKSSNRITQPPGGSSTDIFNKNEEEVETPLKTSKKKSQKIKINPVTGQRL